MATFRLEIKCDNDAFEGADRVHDIARILRETADRIESGRAYNSLRDVNGNVVGEWWIK